jgi:hypothetical protein
MEHKKREKPENETKSMGGVIIVFKNPKAEPKKLCKFCREFYGYKDHSQKGKYTYQRKGLLNEMPHIKINHVRTVIVVKEEDSETVINFLKKYDATVYARKIELSSEDISEIKEHQK